MSLSFSVFRLLRSSSRQCNNEEEKLFNLKELREQAEIEIRKEISLEKDIQRTGEIVIICLFVFQGMTETTADDSKQTADIKKKDVM